MILLGIILFLTVLEAIHEGLALRYRVKLEWVPGIIEAVKLLGIVVLIPLIQYLVLEQGWRIESLLMYFFGWVLLRYAIFDPIHNLCAGKPIFYVGYTKLYDKVLLKIDKKQGVLFHSFTKPIALACALLLIFQADLSELGMRVVTWSISGVLAVLFTISFGGMLIGYVRRLFNKDL
jgi:hypothetical protein